MTVPISEFQQGFARVYTGNPPWEIGRPQAPFVRHADQITSPLLDCGCGTGNASVFFAARGLRVTGIDFVDEAIRRARAKAEQAGVEVEFAVMDAMTLVDWDRRFASIMDSGLYHIYDHAHRQVYIRGLAHVLEPGGRLFLFSFTDDEPSVEGGVSLEELHNDFSDGWEVESVEPMRGELNPALAAATAGPKMWFAIIRRK